MRRAFSTRLIGGNDPGVETPGFDESSRGDGRIVGSGSGFQPSDLHARRVPRPHGPGWYRTGRWPGDERLLAVDVVAAVGNIAGEGLRLPLGDRVAVLALKSPRRGDATLGSAREDLPRLNASTPYGN